MIDIRTPTQEEWDAWEEREIKEYEAKLKEAEEYESEFYGLYHYD